MSPVATRAAGLLALFLGLAMPAQAFDARELQGLWGESLHSRYACAPGNRYQRFALTADGKRLVVTAQHGLKGRKLSVYELEVTRSDEHSLYLQFPGHTEPSDPLAGEWAFSVLGPGVYRWHLASGQESVKSAPIGVRCAP